MHAKEVSYYPVEPLGDPQKGTFSGMLGDNINRHLPSHTFPYGQPHPTGLHELLTQFLLPECQCQPV